MLLLFLLHLPPRIVLIDLLVQTNDSRDANNLVAHVETITTKFHGFGEASDGQDRGCAERPLDGWCEKVSYRGGPGDGPRFLGLLYCDPLVSLVTGRLETVYSLTVLEPSNRARLNFPRRKTSATVALYHRSLSNTNAEA